MLMPVGPLKRLHRHAEHAGRLPHIDAGLHQPRRGRVPHDVRDHLRVEPGIAQTAAPARADRGGERITG